MEQLTLIEISTRLERLERQLADIAKKAGPARVAWQTKKSDSGIEIVGGPTTVEETGVLLTVQMVPVGPGQLQVFAFVKSDAGASAAIDFGAVRFL